MNANARKKHVKRTTTKRKKLSRILKKYLIYTHSFLKMKIVNLLLLFKKAEL